MSESSFKIKQLFFIGTMLFALFFGAGNLIFPAMLGQKAGTSFWLANLGFMTTGVLLPLLGVIALGYSKETDFLAIAKRAGPIFGLAFTTTLYLAIGPLFAMPRTGSTSYELALKPFISADFEKIGLFIFSLLYFGISFIFGANPNKIVDIVGKYLTPVLLFLIAFLCIYALIFPMGNFQPPIKEYINTPFFKGFREGYLTMDTLASCIFGLIVIQSIQECGITDKKMIQRSCVISSLIAAGLLALVYLLVSYLGASSVEKIGILENGADVLSSVASFYFGRLGLLILGVIVILACLTTSIGLTVACASYFHRICPKISYFSFAAIFSIFSMLFANIGLTQLIQVSVPVLVLIYPMTIVLIALMFLNNLVGGKKNVYFVSLIFTFAISIFDGFKALGIEFKIVESIFNQILPLYSQGLGWLFPAIIGGVIGYFLPEKQKVEE